MGLVVRLAVLSELTFQIFVLDNTAKTPLVFLE